MKLYKVIDRFITIDGEKVMIISDENGINGVETIVINDNKIIINGSEYEDLGVENGIHKLREKNKTPERGYYIRTNEYKSAVINDVFEELLFMKEFYGNKLNKDLSKDAIVLKNAINIVWEELLLYTNIDILVKDKKERENETKI